MVFGNSSNFSRPMAQMSYAAPNMASLDDYLSGEQKNEEKGDYDYDSVPIEKSVKKEKPYVEKGDDEKGNKFMEYNADDEYDAFEGDSNNMAYEEMNNEEKDFENNSGLQKEKELEAKKESLKEKKVEFSNKELVLTQDIFDGFWNLNHQTKLLIEKEKNIYEKIENFMKEKNIQKEEVKITLLVLYYLNTDTSINKVEYMLIIKKGISFLAENGINFDEILPFLKN